MQTRTKIFTGTLVFSIILEIYVRFVVDWQVILPVFGFFPYTDSVMHLFWGLNVFFMGIIWLRWKPRDALILVLVTQMFWEAIEMIGDQVIPQGAYMLDHFFFDGLKDTLFNFIGGLFGYFILKNTQGGLERLRKSRYHDWMVNFLLLCIPMALIGSVVYFTRLDMIGPALRSPDIFATAWIIAAIPLSWGLTKLFSTKTARG